MVYNIQNCYGNEDFLPLTKKGHITPLLVSQPIMDYPEYPVFPVFPELPESPLLQPL